MPKILILDYSTDRKSAAEIRRWLSKDCVISERFVDTEQSLEGLDPGSFTHIIHSGSALSIVDEAPFTAAAHGVIRRAADRGICQFGICYGQQLLCQAMVGSHAVRRSPKGLEAGWKEMKFTELGQQRLGVRSRERVWSHHYDEVIELPPGSEILATNDHTRIQAFRSEERGLFGTQFHPEFDLNEGNRVFQENADKLRNKGFDVEKILRSTPTIDAGNVFFGHFMAMR